MTNEQFRNRANEQWVNDKAESYINVNGKIYKIASVYASEKDNIVIEASADLQVSSNSEIPNNWHTGTPSDPLSLYLVLWFDTEDRVYRYSVLNWHDRLNCWYDEETPDSLWGDEYKAKVLLWLPIGTPIRAARQLLESQQKGR